MSSSAGTAIPLALQPAPNRGVMGSKVPVYVHAIVKDSDYNNFGISARSVENYMAALTKFFVFWLNVIGIFANLGLAGKQLESIIKLFQVFISLPFPPFLRGKSTNLYHVFPGSSGKQIWAH